MVKSKLLPGEELKPNEMLASEDGKYTLSLVDGELVWYKIYGPVRRLWSSRTKGMNVSKAIMQTDGNFVLYDTEGKALWASNTCGLPGAWLQMVNATGDEEGDVKVYCNRVVWCTDTAQN